MDGYRKIEKTAIESEHDFYAWRVASLLMKNSKVGIKIVGPDPTRVNKKCKTARSSIIGIYIVYCESPLIIFVDG